MPVSRIRLPIRDDRGAALLMVMAWGLLMMGLVLVVSQAVVRQIVPSDRSEQSFAALAAAEAGIEDIEARLLVLPITSVVADPDNAALSGWVPVPGGESDAEFTYAIDASKSGAVGEIRAYVTGRSGTVTRTIESVLSKRSTLDYVYMSDIETPAPDLPGAYSSAANSGGTGRTAQELARLVCARHWYESGQVSPTTTGNQRNLDFCQWAGIYSSEKLVGRLHTNDVWRLETVDLGASGTLGAGKITSSCRSTEDGLLPGEVGCPSSRRYIATSGTGLNSNNSSNADWDSPDTDFQGDAWRPASGTDPTQRNPLYDTILELPPSPSLLKQRASETGCVYTGPTRIRFATEGGVGYMYVTSPDTKVTRPGCDGVGGDGTTLQSPATSQATRKVNLSDFSDLVIYVQAVRRSTEADDTSNDFDLSNQWAIGDEPTCAVKSSRQFPFVIPSDATDQANFDSGGSYKGFPSESADPTNPWYSTSCANGDIYVQGQYKGAMTLAAEHNVVLTSSLTDSTAATSGADLGKPSASSQSTLGVVANKFAYIYRPFAVQKSTYTWASNRITVTYPDHGLKVGDSIRLDFTSGGATSKDGTKTVLTVPSANSYTFSQTGSGTAGNVTFSGWDPAWLADNAVDPTFNFALLAIENCFAAQDPYTAPRQGNIYMWGSLAQKFRCVVGSTGGYNKIYKYDDRLAQRTPPYMLELSNEPWGTQRYGEINLDSQSVGTTVDWPLLTAAESSSTVRNVRLTSTPGEGSTILTTVGTDARLTPSSPGMVVVTYEVVTGDLVAVRRLVVLVE